MNSRSCLIVLTTLATPLLAAGERFIDDPEITRAVKDALAAESGVEAPNLEVSTQKGIVTLAGPVSSLLEKEWASMAAETIKGVRAVIDRTEVACALRTDREIEADIREAYRMDPAIDRIDVSVGCSRGKVALSGRVEGAWERTLCAKLAKGVRGVRSVDNNIEVALTVDRPDAEIEAEIRRRWQLSPWIDERSLSVAVEDGHVRISGAAGSASERSNAHLFSYVAGVRGIDSSAVEVKPEKGRDLSRTNPHRVKPDDELKRNVLDSLRYDPRVRAAAIRVETLNGVVTLGGSVETLTEKRAAGSDARNTIGVLRVTNDLAVRPPRYPKEAIIERAARAAFARDPYLGDDRIDIDIEVQDGVLTLRGHVDSRFEREHAETVAVGIRWIRKVENRIHVRRANEAGGLSDATLRRRVTERIYWNPFLDSSRIEVEVKAGKVVLSGSVDDYHQFAGASKIARDAGATGVENLLDVSR